MNEQKFTGGFTGLAFTTDRGEIPAVADVDAPLNKQWYINEEKDSARRLREAYAAVRAKAGGAAKGRANGHARSGANGSNGAAASAPSSDAEAIIACMTAGFQSLEKSIERLAKAAR